MKITKKQLNALIESFLLNEDSEVDYESEVGEEENETSDKKSSRGYTKVKYASPYLGNTLSEFQNWASKNGMPGEFMNYLDHLENITNRSKELGNLTDLTSAGGVGAIGGQLSTEQGRKAYQQEQTDGIALFRKFMTNANGPYTQQAFSAITDKAKSIIEYIYSNGGAPVGPGTEWSPSALIDKVRGSLASVFGDTSPRFMCSDSGAMIALVPMTVDYQKNKYVPALEKDMPHPVDVELKKIRSTLSKPPGYQSDIDIKIPGSDNYLEPAYIVPIRSINDIATSLSLVDKFNEKNQLTKSDIDQQIRDRGQDLVTVVIAFTKV
jgi:hypothetical protein